MIVLDLTECPAGQFSTYLLSELGHTVLRPIPVTSELSELAYNGKKTHVSSERVAAQAGGFDVIVIDDWFPGREWLEERGWWAAVAARSLIVNVVGGSPSHPRLTGFLLDHGLGISDELPAGNPYRHGYTGPSLALPGRVTDHDAGVQAAIAALAWCGHTGTIELSVAQAAMVSHRYAFDIGDLEPETFRVRNAKAGIPFGGILTCKDGYIDLVVFTAGAWKAIANWLDNPDWTRHPDYPTKAYIDQYAERYQGEILAWAAARSVHEIVALADRDDVPVARFATIDDALADPYRVAEGYVETVMRPALALPSLPYKPRPIAPTSATAIVPLSAFERPLAGVVVVDFTVAQAGAHAAWVLAQLGATVIKIEHRDKPDIARLWTPGKLDTSFAFLEPNAGKQSLLIRWDTPAGREILFKLVARADVFLTNVRPSVLKRLNLTAANVSAANPAIVYATISSDGIGDAERANRPGWAMTFGAASGIGAAVTGDGEPPAEMSGWADYAVGNQAALAVLQALQSRRRGLASSIDTSATSALSLLLRDTAIERSGLVASSARRVLVQCSDGAIAYDASFVDAALPAFESSSCADTLRELHASHIPAARQVRMEDVFSGDNGFAIDPFWELEPHIVLGRARRTVKPAWSSAGVPIGTRQDAPWLGEHTQQILSSVLALSDEDIASAEAAGTVG